MSEHGKTQKSYKMITDYVTGEEIPRVGAEENRQAVERFLVDELGYDRSEIVVDEPLSFPTDQEIYGTELDLVLRLEGRPLAVIKCAAGALASRDREVISAARILEGGPAPYAVVSDGEGARVLLAETGSVAGEGMWAIPTREQGVGILQNYTGAPLPEDRLERQRLVFKTYDMANVNVRRKMESGS
ncbi:MAG: type I restriction enzyme HsdR N-terminal domain-containing protein [Desulfatibacillaceae bacterium]